MQLKITKYSALAVLLFVGLPAIAQITAESPYSRFGLGSLKSSALTKSRGMGGIGIGINAPTAISYSNTQNPAAFSSYAITSLEAGMSAKYLNLKKGNQSENSLNGTFNHIAIGFPVTKKSGMSIGLLPYSELGYDYKSTGKIDTLNTAQSFTGEGGITKAYLGYGYKVSDRFRLGASLEYLFGSMIRTRTTEFGDVTALNVRIQEKDNIYGMSLSYGAQYDFDLNPKVKLIIGYAGTVPTKLSSKVSNTITRYTKDTEGNDNPALDTLNIQTSAPNKFKLPLSHGFGFSIQKYNNWVFGADVKVGNWSNLEIGGVNQGLTNTLSVAVGGQWTPDIMAVSGYFNRVDYRLGLVYEKSYVNISNQNINQKSVTFGMGFPLATVNRFTFSKLNFSAELGTRGTLTNNLVKEQFVNFHLGFTLNDRWFTRFKFD